MSLHKPPCSTTVARLLVGQQLETSAQGPHCFQEVSRTWFSTCPSSTKSPPRRQIFDDHVTWSGSGWKTHACHQNCCVRSFPSSCGQLFCSFSLQVFLLLFQRTKTHSANGALRQLDLVLLIHNVAHEAVQHMHLSVELTSSSNATNCGGAGQSKRPLLKAVGVRCRSIERRHRSSWKPKLHHGWPHYTTHFTIYFFPVLSALPSFLSSHAYHLAKNDYRFDALQIYCFGFNIKL